MHGITVRLRILAVLVVACATAAGTSLAGIAYAGSSGNARTSAHSKHANSKHHTHAKRPVFIVKTAKVKKLGTVLVNSTGRVLYVYAPDKAKKVVCNSSCQAIWPPATVPAKAKLKAKGAVKQKLLGTASNPVTHKRILTYNHWPLYTYMGDSTPGQATGQNIDSTGGFWWVIRPGGSPLK